MKKLFLLVLTFFSTASFAQPKIKKLDKSSIPNDIQYTGNLVNALRWTDNPGDNIVITTETGISESKGSGGEDYRNAALDAWHYRLEAGSWKMTWKVHDFIKECPVDLAANYIKNSFAVTDLDKDGIAEVWMMYKTVCHGDVSPSTLKIIMYQGDNKYAVRGTTRVRVSEKDYYGGEYTFDEAFKKAPQQFREYASRLWKKNVVETWK